MGWRWLQITVEQRDKWYIQKEKEMRQTCPVTNGCSVINYSNLARKWTYKRKEVISLHGSYPRDPTSVTGPPNTATLKMNFQILTKANNTIPKGIQMLDSISQLNS